MAELFLKNVSKIFEDGTVGIEEISFAIDRAGVFGLFGPSGSGKSTLINVIGKIEKPTSGEISGNALKKRRAFIFQNLNLVEDLSALENLEIVGRLCKVKDAKKKSFEILDKLGLLDKAHKKPRELSGGERQRVAVGRAILVEAGLILADEPTASLGPTEGQRVMELLLEISKLGALILVATHDRELSQYFLGEIYLKGGRIEGLRGEVRGVK